ncbi:hypothetical protein MRB53_040070 [Persea americana]|nr:hypothetical protein MRB53_040070 [Persea americana]
MSIEIQPVSLSDVSDMVAVGALAFAASSLEKLTFPVQDLTAQQLEEYTAWRRDRAAKRTLKPGSYWYKAVNAETGELAGYTGILQPEVPQISLPDKAEFPSNANVEAILELKDELEAKKTQNLGDRSDVWCRHTIDGSQSHYQRRGVAKLLLDKTLAHADAAGQDVYLESTQSGLKLYQAAGFVVLDTLVHCRSSMIIS